jgi:hypothetical protein
MAPPVIDAAAGIASAGKSTRRSAPKLMDRNSLARLREMLSVALPAHPGVAASLDDIFADGGGREIAARNRRSRVVLHGS